MSVRSQADKKKWPSAKSTLRLNSSSPPERVGGPSRDKKTWGTVAAACMNRTRQIWGCYAQMILQYKYGPTEETSPEALARRRIRHVRQVRLCRDLPHASTDPFRISAMSIILSVGAVAAWVVSPPAPSTLHTSKLSPPRCVCVSGGFPGKRWPPH